MRKNAGFKIKKQNRRERKKARSHSALFFRTFILSFCFMLAISMSVLAWISSRAQEEKPANTTPDARRAYQAQKDEALNILAIGCETRAAPVKSLLLLRYDPALGTFSAAAVPPYTKATLKGQSRTVEEFYDYGGIPSAVEAVSNAFSVKIDRYIRYDRQTAESFIDFLGGIEYDMPQALDYLDKETAERTLIEKGLQTLDGRRVYQISHYPLFPGGETYRLNKQSELAVLLVSQKMNGALVPNLDSVYNKFINIIDTNITAYDYAYRKNGICYMLEKAERSVSAVKISGYFDISSSFEPDLESLERVISVFGEKDGS